MAYDAAKKAMKKEEDEEKAEAKVAVKITAAVAKVKAKEAAAVAKNEKTLSGIISVPEDILVRPSGNSAEEIAVLEEDYNFSEVSVSHRAEPFLWFFSEAGRSKEMVPRGETLCFPLLWRKGSGFLYALGEVKCGILLHLEGARH